MKGEAGTCRLLREKTEAAEALTKQEEAAEQERRRVRATVRDALGKRVSLGLHKYIDAGPAEQSLKYTE